ncbi:classical arabinogalactan protein 1-like [Eucalyptus grandis]|uniref:classical arabinogalactan protein 1-like n=1 Tax=Eucalyptus grandis TaxID=71139 RepID=UPI00192ECB39|nr:classical arabinogalactan protein 1-like [Eucalyptus grandis]
MASSTALLSLAATAILLISLVAAQSHNLSPAVTPSRSALPLPSQAVATITATPPPASALSPPSDPVAPSIVSSPEGSCAVDREAAGCRSPPLIATLFGVVPALADGGAASNGVGFAKAVAIGALVAGAVI